MKKKTETDEMTTVLRTRPKIAGMKTKTETEEMKTASRTRPRRRRVHPNTNENLGLGLQTHRPSTIARQNHQATNPRNGAAASRMIEDAAAASPNTDPIPDTGGPQKRRIAQREREARNLAKFRRS